MKGNKPQRTPQGKTSESDRKESLPKNTGMPKGGSPLAQSKRSEGKTASSDHKEVMEAKSKPEKMDKENGPDRKAHDKGPHQLDVIDHSEAKVDDALVHARNAQARMDEVLHKERGANQLHQAVDHLKIPTDCPM